MGARALIKLEDVKRLMAGAKQSGFSHVRLSIAPDGTITVDADDAPAPQPQARRNPLDRLLVNEDPVS